jgi:hypothetical protein
LSRLVRTAAGSAAELTRAEFDAVRELLEDQRTWTLLGRGTVDDLAERIADRLQPGEGRTAGNSHAAALAIARGLLEFAVADLDPKLFQQILLARLQRMETGQASALDTALLALHTCFASVMDQLKLVTDRMPPGPATHGEIVVYLRTLIDWLSTDPWPRDPQFDASVLAPAAIERKLDVTVTGREESLDADALAQQCRRLVILGSPGSGKTWLARRTARRCAENALQVLAADGSLDEVELPIYTTCSRLFAAGGDIREAVVSSALDQLADLGGSRISAALRVFFTERNMPTVLVIDSLDEAHGPSERLRQADTLPWRIILTSRPSSWRKQLSIDDSDESHQIGELQPLRYPDDVESFIQHWFAGQPARGQDLTAQIARRPGLQQAANVPLILAFYCIVAGSGPLPEFRRDLYTRVLRRMLTGRWRGDDDRQPDADTCLRTLDTWAWHGATSNHPVSGVGMWADDIPTERLPLRESDAYALDHVATPVGPPDVDTGKILRRFIHRSIREHLVAAHVASLPRDQAVKALLPHLWYDPDWENVIPSALAQHPERDQLVRDLIRSAATSTVVPEAPSVLDGAWQFRIALARAAAESSETDWSPDVARIIEQVRADLALSARFSDLGGATSWASSNRLIRGTLLGVLARAVEADDLGGVNQLAGGVIQLAATTEDKRQVREALLRLLILNTDAEMASHLAWHLIQLDPTTEDKRQARDVVLRLLVHETKGSTATELAGDLIQLDPTTEDKRQARDALLRLMADQTQGYGPRALAGAVIQLVTTTEDKRQVRDALLRLLIRQAESDVAEQLADGVILLATTTQDKRQARNALLRLMAHETQGHVAQQLARGVAELDPTAEDKRQAREALLELLARETKGSVAAPMAGGLFDLDPTAEDKRRAREALLGLLTRETQGSVAAWMAGGLFDLDPTAEDKRRARDALLGLLTRETQGYAAEVLAHTVAELATTANDNRHARDALLKLLVQGLSISEVAQGNHDEVFPLLRTSQSQATARVARGLVELNPTVSDKRHARAALLKLLARETDSWAGQELASVIGLLNPTAEDKRHACEDLVRLLPAVTDDEIGAHVAHGLIELATTAEDKRHAREALLKLVTRLTEGDLAAELARTAAKLIATAEDNQPDREALVSLRLLTRNVEDILAVRLARTLAELDPTAEDKRRAREALVSLLAKSPSSWTAGRLAQGVIDLATTAEDKQHARDALLRLMAHERQGYVAGQLARGVAELDPTAEDKRQAREVLVRLLARETESHAARSLADSLALLDPTGHDLGSCPDWAVRPTTELLAAVRRNSALTDWLGTPLTSPSDSPA